MLDGLVVAGLVVGASVGQASANWESSVTGVGHGTAGAATVAQGATPAATPGAGGQVGLSWSATSLSNGLPADGYVVRRYAGDTGALQPTLAGCGGTLDATRCTETGVPSGQWRYTVTPAIAVNWRGQESPESAAITVAGSGPVAPSPSNPPGSQKATAVDDAGTLSAAGAFILVAPNVVDNVGHPALNTSTGAAGPS